MAYKPKRIAPPSIIADATSAVLAAVERSAKIDDAQKNLWINAVTKAFAQLIDGVRFDVQGDDMIFPSRTRTGLAHRVNGTCSCEASAEQGQPCWHRAAKRIIQLVEDYERETLVTPPLAQRDQPYRCVHCLTRMNASVTHANTWLCPACGHAGRTPRRQTDDDRI